MYEDSGDLQEEDEVIASLEAKEEDKQYCDYEFIPHPRSLYVNEHFVPNYDQGVQGDLVWARPLEMFADPQYFKSASYAPTVISGRLDDRWLLGVFCALAAHPMDLIEELFCSRPDDFRNYGVYTCRFYKEGEWCTVMTDTRLPCLASDGPGGNKTKLAVMYGTSLAPGEMWVALLEKAYAKFLGCYEAIHDGYIADALMHLTGGVTTHFGLQLGGKPQKFDFDMVFEEAVAIPPRSAVMVCEYVSPGEESASEPSELGIVSRRPYTIVRFLQVADVRLVLLRTPWEGSTWSGPWAAHDRAWEDYPDVARMLAEDETLTPFWTIDDPHCICMLYTDFWREFSDLYVCRLFDDEFKQYSVVGQWRGKFTGGPRQASADGPSDSKQREDADDRKAPGYNCCPTASSARVPTTVGGETSWFLNPQFAVTSDAATSMTVSLMLLGQPAGKQANHRRIHPGFEIMKLRKSTVPQRVWECQPSNLLATVPDKMQVLHKMSTEAVLGAINIDPKYCYVIVPHTSARGREARFLLRVFSSTDLKMVELPEPHFQLLPGAWHKNSDLDSAGGPLIVRKKSKKGEYEDVVSTRWNQNPQYLLRLPSSLGQARVNVKIIVRKVEKEVPKHGPKKRGHTSSSGSSADRRSAAIGLVVTKPSIPPSNHRRRPKQDEPRMNALGEIVTSRVAKAERRRLQHTGESNDQLAPLEGSQVTVQHAVMSPDQEGRIARKLTVAEGDWYLQTHFSNSPEICIFFQGLSRTWIKEGMLISPCLAERNATGYFEVEVHSDAPTELLQLPDAVAKSVTGEWNAQTAGGSHLHQETWKNNPKYTLRFSDRTTPKRIHITLSRPAQDWVKANKKDPVGSMIGFYIFSTPRPSRGNNSITYDGNPWSETPFVPVHDVSTPSNFVLPAPASQEEDFTVMPCTLDPNHIGPFFLSVVSDAEFAIHHSRGR